MRAPPATGGPLVVYGAAPVAEDPHAVSDAVPAAEGAATGTDVEVPPTEAGAPSAAAASGAAVDATDPTGRMVADTRRKLKEIDKLLKDTAQ